MMVDVEVGPTAWWRWPFQLPKSALSGFQSVVTEFLYSANLKQGLSRNRLDGGRVVNGRRL